MWWYSLRTIQAIYHGVMFSNMMALSWVKDFNLHWKMRNDRFVVAKMMTFDGFFGFGFHDVIDTKEMPILRTLF